MTRERPLLQALRLAVAPLAAALLLTGQGARADDAQPQITQSQAKTSDCYCTDKTGARVELGETICLHVDGRMFMAQCQMSLNNPMWREISEGCVSSSLPRTVMPTG